MRCAWADYLKLLPQWMQRDVDELGRNDLQELRLRLDGLPELILGGRSCWLSRPVSMEDLHTIINWASQYSPWAAATIRNGYITAQGGHRIGLCGEAVVNNGSMTGIRTPTSLCLRVARDYPGIAKGAAAYSGSVLILGRPGSGKTTLLRDFIRQRSDGGNGAISVIDERGELFPMVKGKSCFPAGKRTDIMTSCEKKEGIHVLLRTMSPSCIAVDEITDQQDCDALYAAGWCGVTLLATAHATDKQDLLSRPVYQPIVTGKLFDTLLIMQPDKSWRAERM